MTIDPREIRRRIHETLDNTDVDHLVTKDQALCLEDQLMTALLPMLVEPEIKDAEARLVAAAINGDEEARETLIERADVARERIKEVLRDSGLDPDPKVLEVKVDANRTGERKPWTPPTHFWGRAGVLNIETGDGRMLTELPQQAEIMVLDTFDREKDRYYSEPVVIGRIDRIWLNDESGAKAILFEGTFGPEMGLRDDLWAGTYPQMSLNDVDFEERESLTEPGKTIMVTTSSKLVEIVLGDHPAWPNLFFRSGEAPADVRGQF